ncbi:Sulfur carrier protein ThiS (plasmid) [Candidatus Erwinia haradaeae]|uniref:Sulfur carrier protein ThiS n=1 Tax=Candidatus Erwinia haradaeae TaxID=1922217 RepID=A0A451DDU1_9GAMM|nr:sulfur carrier protein ThiS [Candidatus Erwinia haradaeae]VFP84638.1 Sulfur carrier protein ThiS [Candidatus Erwinia haradaeae]
MAITFNDLRVEIPHSLTIDCFLAQQCHDAPLGTALALNQTIIPRSNWKDYQVKDGDDILLFQAIAGG